MRRMIRIWRIAPLQPGPPRRHEPGGYFCYTPGTRPCPFCHPARAKRVSGSTRTAPKVLCRRDSRSRQALRACGMTSQGSVASRRCRKALPRAGARSSDGFGATRRIRPLRRIRPKLRHRCPDSPDGVTITAAHPVSATSAASFPSGLSRPRKVRARMYGRVAGMTLRRIRLPAWQPGARSAALRRRCSDANPNGVSRRPRCAG
jgi:hypothetical protein